MRGSQRTVDGEGTKFPVRETRHSLNVVRDSRRILSSCTGACSALQMARRTCTSPAARVRFSLQRLLCPVSVFTCFVRRELVRNEHPSRTSRIVSDSAKTFCTENVRTGGTTVGL